MNLKRGFAAVLPLLVLALVFGVSAFLINKEGGNVLSAQTLPSPSSQDQALIFPQGKTSDPSKLEGGFNLNTCTLDFPPTPTLPPANGSCKYVLAHAKGNYEFLFHRGLQNIVISPPITIN